MHLNLPHTLLRTLLLSTVGTSLILPDLSPVFAMDSWETVGAQGQIANKQQGKRGAGGRGRGSGRGSPRPAAETRGVAGRAGPRSAADEQADMAAERARAVAVVDAPAEEGAEIMELFEPLSKAMEALETSLSCPVSLELMGGINRPMVLSNGQTIGEESLNRLIAPKTKYLQCPLTKDKILLESCHPNYKLVDAIEGYNGVVDAIYGVKQNLEKAQKLKRPSEEVSALREQLVAVREERDLAVVEKTSLEEFVNKQHVLLETQFNQMNREVEEAHKIIHVKTDGVSAELATARQALEQLKKDKEEGLAVLTMIATQLEERIRHAEEAEGELRAQLAIVERELAGARDAVEREQAATAQRYMEKMEALARIEVLRNEKTDLLDKRRELTNLLDSLNKENELEKHRAAEAEGKLKERLATAEEELTKARTIALHLLRFHMAVMRTMNQVGDDKMTANAAFDAFASAIGDEYIEASLRASARFHMAEMREFNQVGDDKMTTNAAFDTFVSATTDLNLEAHLRAAARFHMAQMRVMDQVGNDKMTANVAFDAFDSAIRDQQDLRPDLRAAARFHKAQMRVMDQVGNDKMTAYVAFDAFSSATKDQDLEASIRASARFRRAEMRALNQVDDHTMPVDVAFYELDFAAKDQDLRPSLRNRAEAYKRHLSWDLTRGTIIRCFDEFAAEAKDRGLRR